MNPLHKETNPLWFLLVFGIALMVSAYLTEQKKAQAEQAAGPVILICRGEYRTPDELAKPDGARLVCVQDHPPRWPDAGNNERGNR